MAELLSLGVEEEFLVVDPATGELVPRAPPRSSVPARQAVETCGSWAS